MAATTLMTKKMPTIDGREPAIRAGAHVLAPEPQVVEILRAARLKQRVARDLGDAPKSSEDAQRPAPRPRASIGAPMSGD